MTLILKKRSEYVNSYLTNLGYLRNMAFLQMKLIEKMEMHKEDIFIFDTGSVPFIDTSKVNTEHIMNLFINHLNAKIKGF